MKTTMRTVIIPKDKVSKEIQDIFNAWSVTMAISNLIGWSKNTHQEISEKFAELIEFNLNN